MINDQSPSVLLQVYVASVNGIDGLCAMKTVKPLTSAAYVFREVETLMAVGSLQSSAEVPLVAFWG